MAKPYRKQPVKYSKTPSSNGRTPTPSRRNADYADLIRCQSKKSFRLRPK